ncbi:MAG: ADP-ribosylglycohydrolase family protein [Clostridia bacterium]|nr:ADP-ribosylglycohydrolase family protein [Clostridia bacterium]
MAIIPEDYVERLYAGWLSKLVGIRMGGDIEGSSYRQLKERFGEIDGYPLPVAHYAADDDSNGPMIFIRALNDYTHTRALTAEQIGRTWLNYAPYEHGFFWWGGYGRSTEHTTYLNLYHGIPAPRSGSIAQNGPAIAEQIGGQIFIDTWGLVLPGQPALAAEYAAKAASVSHDGEGIHGGMYVAAEIAMAFTAKSVREIVLGALKYIPEDCEYARAVKDVVRYYDEQPVKDWREAFEYVDREWGYHRYPGVCHIIPNAAAMVLALLYGEEDYDRTMNICTMCGWDTDCNAGNVGTIMGVFKGIGAIDYDKWLSPIEDTFAVSCALGSLNRMDVTWCCAYLADLAYRMAGEPVPEQWRSLTTRRGAFPFVIEGATHGFTVTAGGAPVPVRRAFGLTAAGRDLRFARRTYLGPKDFKDDRYNPAMSPEIWPGQTFSARLTVDAPATARAFAVDYFTGEAVYGAPVPLGAQPVEVSVAIPAGHTIVGEVGVQLSGEAAAKLLSAQFSGAADFGMDFDRWPMEAYTGLHREVAGFTRWKGNWDVEQGALHGSDCDRGEIYTGDIDWMDYAVCARFAPVTGGEAALLLRVGGVLHSAALTYDGRALRLKCNCEGQYDTLASCEHAAEFADVRVECRGRRIRVYEGENLLLEAEDERIPAKGCIGFGAFGGARARFEALRCRVLA